MQNPLPREVRENTRMVVMAHGSNVTGEVFDIQNVGKLCVRTESYLWQIQPRLPNFPDFHGKG